MVHNLDGAIQEKPGKVRDILQLQEVFRQHDKGPVGR